MVKSETLQKKWDQDARIGKTNSEISNFLFECGIYPEFGKRVELVLQSEDPKDALHPEIQEAIISWNQKIYGVQSKLKKGEIYKATDDNNSKVA